MKVILVNGSPNEQGCTFTALSEVESVLKTEGLETEIFWIGKEPVPSCIDCGYCNKNGICTFHDKVNDFIKIADKADGFIFGSPVHYAAPSGAITAFMDRVFFSSIRAYRGVFYLKPAAAVVTARRAGTTTAIDQMNKYFSLTQMPIISSVYWNMVHGTTPEEVREDQEGMQIMRTLARNMAWFLQCKDAAEKIGVPFPSCEEKILTNFIR